MTRVLRRGWCLIGLAVLLSGCIPEFAHPLVGGATADPAIMGKWVGRSAGNSDISPIEISPQGDGIAVVMKDKDAGVQGDGDLRLVGTTAEIGGGHYVNLTPTGTDVPPELGTLIFRYEAKDGTVTVWPANEKVIAAAIKDGTLAGDAKASGPDSSRTVTASSDALAAFIATPAGQAAFNGSEQPLALTRPPS